MTKKLGAGIALGIVGTILVAIALWLTVVYTGAYNVAASDQHFDAVRWTFDTTMRQSVASRAGGAEIPEEASEGLQAQGAAHYADSCAYCHGAPGSEPSEWSRGMRPQPPHLVEAAKEWSSQEIHWIVTNGIKMTGMPAFGVHLSPVEVTAITAFVSALPGLTADDYRRLRGSTQGQSTQVQPTQGAGEGRHHLLRAIYLASSQPGRSSPQVNRAGESRGKRACPTSVSG